MLLVFCIIAVFIPAAVIASFPLFAARAFRRRGERPRWAATTVSVIVPFAGIEDGLARRLALLLSQETAFEAEFIFCVATRDDPVVAVLERSIADHAGRRARIVVAGASGAEPGKIRKLIAGVSAARGDVFVFVDSDAEMDGACFLEHFVADLGRPAAGLVTCFPAYRDARDVPSALVASMINHDLPGYFSILASRGRLSVANGACMAISRATLEAIGGLATVRDRLLIDTRLAQHVVAAGLRVYLHRRPVVIRQRHMSWRAWWDQSLRWQVAMWHGLPRRTYAGFVWLRCGGAISLGVLAATSFSPVGWTVVTAYFAARGISAAWLTGDTFAIPRSRERCGCCRWSRSPTR